MYVDDDTELSILKTFIRLLYFFVCFVVCLALKVKFFSPKRRIFLSKIYRNVSFFFYLSLLYECRYFMFFCYLLCVHYWDKRMRKNKSSHFDFETEVVYFILIAVFFSSAVRCLLAVSHFSLKIRKIHLHV